MDVGTGSERKRSLVWIRDGEVGHSYWPCTQRSNKHKCKHAFTHTQNDRDCSPCVQLLAFPARPQDHTSSAHWKHSGRSTLLRSSVPRVLGEGHPMPLKCHKGAALFLPCPSCPWGRQRFTWISLYRCHTLNEILAAVWTSPVTQADHAPTNPHPFLQNHL